jgi:putative tRNA adenosine deaminase-associated protein
MRGAMSNGDRKCHDTPADAPGGDGVIITPPGLDLARWPTPQAPRSVPGVSTDGFAVAVVRAEGKWRCSLLAAELLDDFDGLVSGLRRLAIEGPVFGLVCVEDEYFVVIRPIPGGVAVLLSDATAALDFDLAADVLDVLHVEVPDEEDIDDDAWPEGDLAILADFGVPEQEMQLIVEDPDLYPDEQLAMMADRAGFGDELHKIIDRL